MAEAWPLLVVVALAHTIETVTGFGATVFALAVGSLMWPLQPLIASLVVLGWLQSAWIVARHMRCVRWRFLMARILPLAGVGLAVGRTLYGSLPTDHLETWLGVFVVGAGVVRLWREGRGEAQQGLGRGWKAVLARVLIPLFGGVIHGLFASGGPVIVILTAIEVPDKGEFRATMSALWLLLNSGMIAWSLGSGSLSDAWPLALVLVPGLIGGIVFGERIHGRIEPRRFRMAVQVVLIAVGLILIVS